MNKTALIASVFEAASNRIVYKNGTPEFEQGAWRKVTDSLLLLLHDTDTSPFTSNYTPSENDPVQESFINEISPAFTETIMPEFYKIEFTRFVMQVTLNLIDKDKFPKTPETLLLREVYRTPALTRDLTKIGIVALELWLNYFYGMCKQLNLPYEKIAGECNRVIRRWQDSTDWIYVDVNCVFYRANPALKPLSYSVEKFEDYTYTRTTLTNGLFLAKKKFIYTDVDGKFQSRGFKEYKNSY